MQQNSTPEVKKKQNRNLIIVISVIVIAFMFLFFAMESKPKAHVQKEQVEFASPIKHVDAESALIEKAETRLAIAEKNTENLKKEVAELSRDKKEQEKNQPKEQEQVTLLTNRVMELEKKLTQTPTTASTQNYTGTIFPSPNQQETSGKNHEVLMTQGIRDDDIILAPSVDAQTVPLKNPETYVPPGTFVKAVTLGGADASAAVNAQANPTPMLFRIIEDGTMPNNKKSRLKGCLATAAVMGDISSERGMARLETLSCIDPDSNRITDMSVEGTVFGSEGKNGIRGTPIWREGALLQRAFVSGSLSGFAKGLSQQYTVNSVSPLGNTQTISGGDVFKYGAAGGASNAMEKLADYNIQRAEQYHPVLQLSAGTTVDLVFLKGFYLDGQKHDDTKQSNVNLNTVQTTGQTVDETKSLQLPLTPEQIKRLKEHEAELSKL